jgi:hypothetical protein
MFSHGIAQLLGLQAVKMKGAERSSLIQFSSAMYKDRGSKSFHLPSHFILLLLDLSCHFIEGIRFRRSNSWKSSGEKAAVVYYDRQCVIPTEFGMMALLVDLAHPCAFATNGIERPSPKPSTT